jgi:N-acetylglucosaminyldiphosphoundecaprenol N-acetyl-beta-D-mannosaminyltransferase
MDTVTVLGFRLVKHSLTCVPLDQKFLINTISPNSYGLSVKDPVMHQALTNSDYLVLDGLYFGLAALLLKGKLIKRISGWDCFVFYSQRMNELQGKVFFLGSSEETLKKIRERYVMEYPNIQVESYSPPFKPEFNEDDLREMHKRINAFKPTVVFVGMTAPKQEKWGYLNKAFVDTNIICTIGNVFDWYAGNSKRPAKFWRIIGLEWFIRIFYRPEIFKRNIENQLLFFWHLFLIVLKIKRK